MVGNFCNGFKMVALHISARNRQICYKQDRDNNFPNIYNHFRKQYSNHNNLLAAVVGAAHLLQIVLTRTKPVLATTGVLFAASMENMLLCLYSCLPG